MSSTRRGADRSGLASATFTRREVLASAALVVGLGMAGSALSREAPSSGLAV
jgi:hypothetical protein